MSNVNETKRRFIGLKVGEISLVDTPANEKEFAVVKRLQEENNMAVENKKVETKKSKEEEGAGNQQAQPEGVKVEIEKPEDQAVIKVLGKVNELVGTLVSRTDPGKEKVEKKETSTEKPDVDENETEEGSEEKTEKREIEEGEKLLSTLEESIAKAKRFTPSRMKTLKQVADSLQSLLTELSPKVEASIDTASSVESSVAKALEDFSSKLGEKINSIVEKKFAEMVDTSKSLGERVEKIEKTRLPSASVEEDGVTDKEVEKKNSNMWAGVL